jgi:predicted peptidase
MKRIAIIIFLIVSFGLIKAQEIDTFLPEENWADGQLHGNVAAIAPMSGFTSHMDFIDNSIDKLTNIPIWAFHGKTDNVVPFEETERIIKKLEEINKDLKFTIELEVGHWINWLVYPNQELYDWFLKHDKRFP